MTDLDDLLPPIISTPQLSVVDDDVYRFVWPGTTYCLELERIHEGRDMDVSAECTIASTVAGTTELLYYGRLNLTAAQTRTTLAKTLTERASQLDWQSALNQVSLMAIDRWRSGDEPVDLSQVEPRESERWLLWPYLSLEGPTLLFGPGMSGKSLLALAMAYSVQTGDAIIGRPAGGRKNVLYLDWETTYDTHAERLLAICRPRNAQVPAILHQHLSAPLGSAIASIRRQCQRHNIGLVVVDSLGMAASGPPEEAESALAMFRALGTLKDCGVLALHHPNKSQTSTGSDRIFGSVFFFNASRIVWEMQSKRRDSTTTIARMTCRKANYHGGLPDHALQITVTETPLGTLDYVSVTKCDLGETPEFTNEETLGRRILAVLRHGPLETSQIAMELGLSEDEEHAVSQRCSYLGKKGLLIKLPQKRGWALKARDEDMEEDLG